MDMDHEELTPQEMGELLTRLGRPLSEEKLQLAFDKIDVNHIGTVHIQDVEAWWTRKTARRRRHRKRSAHYFKNAVETIAEQKQDRIRQSTNEQMMEMIEIFGGMTSRHLRILYDVLDVNGTGLLKDGEIKLLLKKVLRVEPTEILVDSTLSEMDEDGSGTVDFSEFCNFFGID